MSANNLLVVFHGKGAIGVEHEWNAQFEQRPLDWLNKSCSHMFFICRVCDVTPQVFRGAYVLHRTHEFFHYISTKKEDLALRILDASQQDGAPLQCERLFCRSNVTPLHVAAVNNLVRLCDRLIAYGADINALDSRQRTPFNCAILNGSRAAVDFFMSMKLAVPIVCQCLHENYRIAYAVRFVYFLSFCFNICFDIA